MEVAIKHSLLELAEVIGLGLLRWPYLRSSLAGTVKRLIPDPIFWSNKPSLSWPRPPLVLVPHFVVTAPPGGDVGGKASLSKGLECCQAKLPGVSVVSGVA